MPLSNIIFTNFDIYVLLHKILLSFLLSWILVLHNSISRIINNNKYAYNVIFTKFDIYFFITTDYIAVFQLLWILVLHNKLSGIINNNKYAMVQHKY